MSEEATKTHLLLFAFALPTLKSSPLSTEPGLSDMATVQPLFIVELPAILSEPYAVLLICTAVAAPSCPYAATNLSASADAVTGSDVWLELPMNCLVPSEKS